MKKSKLLWIMAPSLILNSANASYYMSKVEGISLSDANYALGDVTSLKRFACDKYRNKPAYQLNCERGVDAAYSIGMQYGAGEGAYLGCIDGYQTGINNGFLVAQNPTQSQKENAEKLLGDAVIQSAKTDGENKARSASTNSTETEIIKRFRSVVRDNPSQQIKKPSRSYRLNVPYWAGVSNGYNSLIDLSGVPSNVKSKLRNVEDKVAAKAIFTTLGNLRTVSDICTTTHPILFNKNLHQVTIWDLFSAAGEFNFKDYGWKSTTRAWNKIASKSGARNSDSYNYHSIEGETEKKRVLVGYEQRNIYKRNPVIDPTTGQPTGETTLATGPDGRPIAVGQENDTNRPIYEWKDVARPGFSKSDLQSKFREGFNETYVNISRTQFAKAFKIELEKSRKQAEGTGKAIGALVAAEVAKMNAYNTKYKSDSRSAYDRKYKELYKTSWDTNFDRFLNNPMVEVEDFTVYETDGNEIFTRGEGIIPKVKLVNIGQEAGTVTMNLSCDIERGTNISQSIAAPASLRKTYTADQATANLVSEAVLNQRQTIVASISSTQMSQVYNLDHTMSDAVIINDIAEIHGTSTEISPLQGSGTVYVNVKNPSNEVNIVDLELTLSSDGSTFSGSLNLGSKDTEDKKSPIQIDGLDPLEIYSNGGVRGNVVTKVGGRIIDSSSFSRTYGESARESILADYFFALINGKTQNSGDELKEDRITTLMEMIASETRNDIDRDVNWGASRAVENTVLGKILKAKRATGIKRNELTPAAQEELNLLAIELNNQYNRAFGYDDYHKLLSELSSVPVEEIGKKQRKGK